MLFVSELGQWGDVCCQRCQLYDVQNIFTFYLQNNSCKCKLAIYKLNIANIVTFRRFVKRFKAAKQ